MVGVKNAGEFETYKGKTDPVHNLPAYVNKTLSRRSWVTMPRTLRVGFRPSRE